MNAPFTSSRSSSTASPTVISGEKTPIGGSMRRPTLPSGKVWLSAHWRLLSGAAARTSCCRSSGRLASSSCAVDGFTFCRTSTMVSVDSVASRSAPSSGACWDTSSDSSPTAAPSTAGRSGRSSSAITPPVRRIVSPPASVDPPRDEQVRLPPLRVGTVGGPHEEAPVGAEVRKPVEPRGQRDALRLAPPLVEDPEVELAAAGGARVRRVEDPAAVGVEGGTEVGGAVAGQRPLVGAVGVHQEDLERGRAHEALRQQRAVLVEGRALGAAGPPHDLRTVGTEERAAVVAGAAGQALRAARLVHHVEVEVAVAD